MWHVEHIKSQVIINVVICIENDLYINNKSNYKR